MSVKFQVSNSKPVEFRNFTCGYSWVARPPSKFLCVRLQKQNQIYWKDFLEQIRVLRYFQHSHLRNWDICHTVGSTFVSCVVEVFRLDWNHRDTHLLLSFWKRWRWSDRNFWGVKKKKMKITGHEVRAIRWMMINYLPAELLQEMCWPSSRVWP